MNHNQKKKQGGIIRDMVTEIRESILVEIIGGIVTFIPRLIIRVVSNLF